MGTLTSALAPVLSIGSTLAGAVNFAQPFIQKSNKNAESDLALRQLEQNTVLQKKQNLLSLQAAETDRREKLKRLVSAQRAAFGGGGVRSGAGSSEAVLQGLSEDSDITRQQNESQMQLDNAALDQRLAQQRQVNLLQKKQLQQKTFLNAFTDLF